MTPYGTTRSRILPGSHALIAPDSHVRAPLPGWTRTAGTILIAPAGGMNAARFTQYLAHMEQGGTSGEPPAGIERFLYVRAGTVTLAQSGEKPTALTPGGYAYLPADMRHEVHAVEASELMLFEKRYVPCEGMPAPARAVIGQEQDVEGKPFLGEESARLQILLPELAEFDLAVNIFTYDPGATLPFVETHIMEHGLLMIAGAGIYRLDESWYPVQEGDAIWMAAYCPQWFAATGKTPARYIYYKDINRDPLGALAL